MQKIVSGTGSPASYGTGSIPKSSKSEIGSEPDLPRTQLSDEIGGSGYAKLAAKGRGFGRLGLAATGVVLATGAAAAILYTGGWLDSSPGASLPDSTKDPAREDLMDASLNGPGSRSDGPDVNVPPTNGTDTSEPGGRVDRPDHPPVSVEPEAPTNNTSPGGRTILRRVEPNLPALNHGNTRTLPNRITPRTLNGTNVHVGPGANGIVQPGVQPGHR